MIRKHLVQYSIPLNAEIGLKGAKTAHGQNGNLKVTGFHEMVDFL